MVADDKNNLKANMMPTIQTDYRANAMIIMIRMVSTIRMIRIKYAMILKTTPSFQIIDYFKFVFDYTFISSFFKNFKDLIAVRLHVHTVYVKLLKLLSHCTI